MANVDPDVNIMKGFVDVCLRKPNYTYPMQLNAPKPKPPFASVMKVNERNPSRDTYKIEWDADQEAYVEVTRGIRIISFHIAFTEGLDEQSRFLASMRRQDVLNYMLINKFGILHHHDADNENTTLESNWEVRDGIIVTINILREYRSLAENGETTIQGADIGGIVHTNAQEINTSVNVSE